MTKTPTINLPAQPNRFIGRVKELHELTDLLADPECRLVTLVGPGGTGKTRLSIEVARNVGADFADGVHFVPLDTVPSADFLVPAIADAIGFTLRGQDQPRIQLLGHLATTEALLVLDNFEHVVEGAGLVSELLAGCPGLKLIVTTREALALSEEWVFPVPGLRIPVDEMGGDLEEYDAVRLFVERAKRVNHAYDPEPDWPHIVRLCRTVQGLPLAIELAATWIKTVPCAQIVAEIEKSVDFLGTRMRNVPERHRTMRAVFDESWRLLTDDERDVFARLSVMRGSFDGGAASQVAGASLQTLSALVDKSLVRPLSDQGRYRVHELLRQYAAERLEAEPDELADVKATHCEHYIRVFAEAGRLGNAGKQLEMAATLSREIDNLRSAWEFAVEAADTEKIHIATQPFALYYQIVGRYHEVAAMLERAARALQDQPLTGQVALTLSLVLAHLGWFDMRLGRLDQSQSSFEIARDVLGQAGLPPDHSFASDPNVGLGLMATIRGDYPEAADYGQKALDTANSNDNPHNREIALYVLARAAILEGRYEDARGFAERAYDTAQQLNDRWFMAYCVLERGNVAAALGDNAAARRFYQETYDLRDEFDDQEGKAIALVKLGEVAIAEEAFETARERFRESIGVYEEIHDKGGLAGACRGMARASLALGELDDARAHLARAISLCAEIRHLSLLLASVTAVGEFLLKSGAKDEGVHLLNFAQSHPASDYETRELSTRLIRDAVLDAKTLGVAPDAVHLVPLLRERLALPTDLGLRVLLDPSKGAPAPPSALPDGLTEREVEVLRLVAQGRSNREISEALFITANTVANHMKNILSKTQTSNRTEAAAYAKDRGLV